MITVNPERQVWTISHVVQCDPIRGTLSQVLSTLVDEMTLSILYFSFLTAALHTSVYVHALPLECMLGLDKIETVALLQRTCLHDKGYRKVPQ